MTSCKISRGATLENGVQHVGSAETSSFRQERYERSVVKGHGVLRNERVRTKS